jgi:hypothetical protein
MGSPFSHQGLSTLISNEQDHSPGRESQDDQYHYQHKHAMPVSHLVGCDSHTVTHSVWFRHGPPVALAFRLNKLMFTHFR